jgi:hypothetical protein
VKWITSDDQLYIGTSEVKMKKDGRNFWLRIAYVVQPTFEDANKWEQRMYEAANHQRDADLRLQSILVRDSREEAMRRWKTQSENIIETVDQEVIDAVLAGLYD